MPYNRASLANIDCNSPSDGARLAAILASPSAWTSGAAVPDFVTSNGARVEVSWYAVVTTTSQVNSSVASAVTSSGIQPGVTVTHVSASNTAASKTVTTRI